MAAIRFVGRPKDPSSFDEMLRAFSAFSRAAHTEHDQTQHRRLQPEPAECPNVALRRTAQQRLTSIGMTDQQHWCVLVENRSGTRDSGIRLHQRARNLVRPRREVEAVSLISVIMAEKEGGIIGSTIALE